MPETTEPCTIPPDRHIEIALDLIEPCDGSVPCPHCHLSTALDELRAEDPVKLGDWGRSFADVQRMKRADLLAYVREIEALAARFERRAVGRSR